QSPAGSTPGQQELLRRPRCNPDPLRRLADTAVNSLTATLRRAGPEARARVARVGNELRTSGPAGLAVRSTWRSPGSAELALDPVDQLFVQVEEAAQEVDYQQQILRPVR